MFKFKSLRHFSNHKAQCMGILKLEIIAAGYLSMVLFWFDHFKHSCLKGKIVPIVS